MYDLDDKIIRLKFHHRSEIQQKDKDWYTVNLWDDEKNIVVEFPKKAYNWFERLPDRGKSWKDFFGLVYVTKLVKKHTGAEFDGAMILAVGKVKTTGMGGKNEYSW